MNLAFFSGNEVFWKTRWEASIDGDNTPYRTLVWYKETHANASDRSADPTDWTGTWRDPRFSPPADGGRPENALTGTIFTVECCQRRTRPSRCRSGGHAAVLAQHADRRGAAACWRRWSRAPRSRRRHRSATNGTKISTTAPARPACMPLSSTTVNGRREAQRLRITYAAATATHSMTLYRHASGALVFGAGTVQWSWGLDGNHDRLPDATTDYTNLVGAAGARSTCSPTWARSR